MKPINLKKSMDAFEEYVKKNDNYHRKSESKTWLGVDCVAQALEESRASFREFLSICRSALDEPIRAAQGKATARLIASDDVVETLYDITKRLDISKAAMNGVKVCVDLNAQHFPSSYSYPPMSTHFNAVYKNGSWRITFIGRYYCQAPSKKITIFHTDASREALIKRFSYMA